MSKDKNDIGVRSSEFKEQLNEIALPRTLRDGTKAMRKAGSKYLPKKKGEDEASYKARKEHAVLLNYFDYTLKYLSGQVFQKPVQYQEIADGEVLESQDFFNLFEEDVDGIGTNLSVFVKNFFEDAVTDGVSFILADYSKVETKTNYKGELLYKTSDGSYAAKTAAADKANGWRPFWVRILASQVLDLQVSISGGKKEVKHFRYEESFVDDEGENSRRVRAYYPNRWEVWEEQGKEEEFVKTETGDNKLGFVPVEWMLTGNEVSRVTAKSGLHDLAHMNAKHFSALSLHDDLMTFVRSPVWLGNELRAGREEDLDFGPGVLLDAGADAKLESIGVDPQSVDKSFQDLKSKEEYMSLYGLQMLTSQNSSPTATQVGITATSSSSQLKGWVQVLSDCIENALQFIAFWEGYKDSPSVVINTEFKIAPDPALLPLLSSMVDKGQLSIATYLEVLKLMGVFADEFNVEDELERIAEDTKNKGKEFMPSLGNFPGEGDET